MSECFKLLDFDLDLLDIATVKFQKINPFKYKPPKPVTQKPSYYIAPPNISSPGSCTWKIALKYKVKQSKKGKFTSNHKAGPIDFETQISLRT